MSMLHNASHRQLYRSEFWSLNLVIPYGLCLFFGQTWNTYFYHHVKHHHVEDNGKFDLSSTSSFQRDSLPQFLLYFARFFFLIQMELPYYFFARGRYWSSAKVFLGEILSLMLFVGLTLRNPAAAITVFVIPFLLMRFFMMVKKIFSLVVDVCFFSFFCCLGCQLGSACVHRWRGQEQSFAYNHSIVIQWSCFQWRVSRIASWKQSAPLVRTSRGCMFKGRKKKKMYSTIFSISVQRLMWLFLTLLLLAMSTSEMCGSSSWPRTMINWRRWLVERIIFVSLNLIHFCEGCVYGCFQTTNKRGNHFGVEKTSQAKNGSK